MSAPDANTVGPAAAAPVFAALGDATRLSLLDRLSTGGPLSISRLTAGSHKTRQAITRHLHVLADAGLVRDVRRGREHHWELDPERLDLARRSLDRISRQWDDALGRLKSFVEESPPES
ncbi:MAG TPA: metalloregulator ArsR/SmtB family transcription factor [Chloroflexota bacterium]|nr:metalloregulator ArsR/SmtB family transcription factor [Chloroflexota bacterium]